MNARKTLNLLLILALLIVPMGSNFAQTLGDTHNHDATGALTGHAHPGDGTESGQSSATSSAHNDQAGHDHATCGSQCFAALISDYSLSSFTPAAVHSVSLTPVNGITLPSEIKPPRNLFS